MHLLMALIPIAVILFVLLVWRAPAFMAGILGWAAAVPVVMYYYGSDWEIVWRSSISGLLASMPVSLVVAASMFQMSLMEESGVIRRFVSLLKAIGRGDRTIQIVLITVGIGSVLNSLGALPMSILPPVMLGIGYAASASILLPSIGYEALNSYAMLGVPIVVLSRFVGSDVDEVGQYFIYYMPVLTTGVSLAALYLWNGWFGFKNGLLPSILAGAVSGLAVWFANWLGLTVLSGLIAGLAVMLAMFLLLRLRRIPIYDRHALGRRDMAINNYIPLSSALIPWGILFVVVTLINIKVLPFYQWVYSDLSMPVEVIPGKPEYIRPFWQAYFWIAVVTLACVPLHKLEQGQWRLVVKSWLRRSVRPTMAASVFFALAFVYNNSGCAIINGEWIIMPEKNIIHILAADAALLFGNMYSLAAPLIGLFGGFLGGTETSSVAMFSELNMRAAGNPALGAGMWFAVAGAIGGGLASVISPAKLANAAASIDKQGEESQLIRPAIWVTFILTGVTAAITYLMVFFIA